MSITIVYEEGAVITLPPNRPWGRGQLGARELDQLRELAIQTNLRQFVGKDLTALDGSDMAILHVFSTVTDPPAEVQVYGYSPFDYDRKGWAHGSTPEPLARLIDALFALREIESTPYPLTTARMRIVDTGESCASKCPWPKGWSQPLPGVRLVPLTSGDLRELDSEWEKTCPPEARGGKPRPRPREFCSGDEQFAWCAAPVFPGIPDDLGRAVGTNR